LRCVRTLDAMDRDPEFIALTKRIGSGIRQRRNELNVSQEELALEAKLTVSYVSQIERGRRNPSTRILFQLCKALQFRVDDLFEK